jgi:hypothetical protein
MKQRPVSHVGYCSPPEGTRFKKGISGNPGGRPKGSLNLATVLLRTLREKITVVENGQTKTVTKLEAALEQLVNKAVAGDHRAIRLLTELAHDAEAQETAQDAKPQDLSEFDHDVIQGILRRVQLTEEQRSPAEEGEPPL